MRQSLALGLDIAILLRAPDEGQPSPLPAGAAALRVRAGWRLRYRLADFRPLWIAAIPFEA